MCIRDRQTTYNENESHGEARKSVCFTGFNVLLSWRSDDGMWSAPQTTTSCTNLATFLNFMKIFTQSCISDVNAWMANDKLQMNNDTTEMILIVPTKFFSSDSVPQSINLDGYFVSCLVGVMSPVNH